MEMVITSMNINKRDRISSQIYVNCLHFQIFEMPSRFSLSVDHTVTKWKKSIFVVKLLLTTDSPRENLVKETVS